MHRNTRKRLEGMNLSADDREAAEKVIFAFGKFGEKLVDTYRAVQSGDRRNIGRALQGWEDFALDAVEFVIEKERD